jgi:hypothetical protein
MQITSMFSNISEIDLLNASAYVTLGASFLLGGFMLRNLYKIHQLSKDNYKELQEIKETYKDNPVETVYKLMGIHVPQTMKGHAEVKELTEKLYPELQPIIKKEIEESMSKDALADSSNLSNLSSTYSNYLILKSWVKLD